MNFSREQIEAAKTPAELEALLAAGALPSRWTLKTLSEVATVFGVATSTVKGWRMESPPMPGTDGEYPLPAIVQWRLAKITGSDLATAQKQATLEATQLANEAKRMELAKERGELIALADAELWAGVACTEARELLMQLPENLATSMPPEHREFVRDETDRQCRNVLATLRRWLESDELAQTTSVVADDDENPQQGTNDER